jgi:O-antigen/teichoic acid export membrane protein
MGILNNIWVAHKANQMYPFLKDKKIQKLDKAEVYTIVKNVKALFIYKVAGTILESTDNIFISALINVVTVGLYSNYRLIVNIFKNIGGQIMNSAVASIGNMQATSDVEKKKEIFYELLFACAWFYGFTASGLFVFLSEFIEIWLGDTYILSTAEVMAICIYYYIQHMNYVADIYRNTAGLFALCKWVPVLAAILNIALDILLGIHFGLVGIVWATIISRSVSMNIVDPVLVYKNVLKGNVMGYFLKNAIYGLSTILIMEISKGILSVIQLHGLYGIIVKAIIFTVMFNSIFLLVNFKNKAKCDLIRRLRQLVIRRR